MQGIEDEINRIVKIAKPIKDKAQELRNLLERGFFEYPILSKIPSNYPDKLCIVAIDTGFIEPPAELTGGRLAVIIRAHAFFGCTPSCIEKQEASAMVKFIESENNIAKPLSKIVERKFIIELLKRKKNGELHLDMVLLDGELIPRIPWWYSPKAKVRNKYLKKLYNTIIDLSNEMFRLAHETSTALVGIVKRSYGHLIGPLVGIPDLPLNDKAIATYILKPGEYIDLGYCFDILEKTESMLNELKENKVLRRILRHRTEWLRKVIEYVWWSGHTKIILYKAWQPTYFSLATKVEIWPSDLLLIEHIVGFLAANTGVNGVPYQIDVVDSMCRIPKTLLFETQQEMFRNLAERLNDPQLAMSIAGLTNPEKMSRIGFK